MKLQTKATVKDNRIAVTVRRNFKDGAFDAAFLALGYRAGVWKGGEKRYLPRELIMRLESRGYEIALSPEDAKESLPPQPPAEEYQPPSVDEKYEGQPFIRCVALRGFADGKFGADLLTYGYRAKWDEGEIREIPASLFAAIQTRTHNLSTKPEDIAEHESRQGKFELRNKLFIAEKSEQVQRTVAQYQARKNAAQVEAEKAAKREELGV